MHVDTVAELIAELNALTAGQDQTQVLVTDVSHALGLEVRKDNSAILITNCYTQPDC